MSDPMKAAIKYMAEEAALIASLRAELEAVKAERLELAGVIDQWNRSVQAVTDARAAQAKMSREYMDNRPVKAASKRHGQACKALAVAAPLARRILSEAAATKIPEKP